jgi:hypothetical protein
VRISICLHDELPEHFHAECAAVLAKAARNFRFAVSLEAGDYFLYHVDQSIQLSVGETVPVATVVYVYLRGMLEELQVELSKIVSGRLPPVDGPWSSITIGVYPHHKLEERWCVLANSSNKPTVEDHRENLVTWVGLQFLTPTPCSAEQFINIQTMLGLAQLDKGDDKGILNAYAKSCLLGFTKGERSPAVFTEEVVQLLMQHQDAYSQVGKLVSDIRVVLHDRYGTKRLTRIWDNRNYLTRQSVSQ